MPKKIQKLQFFNVSPKTKFAGTNTYTFHPFMQTKKERPLSLSFLINMTLINAFCFEVFNDLVSRFVIGIQC
ncbi:hypothetical protein D3C72_583530 [compost metagenome]